MPIYEYVCSACKHRADILHGRNETGPNFCPECGAEGTMRKAFAAPAIHFKGSGWAKKDRSASRTKAAAKAESGTSDAKSGEASSKAGGGESDSSEPSSKSSSDSKSAPASSASSSSASAESD